MNQKHEIIAALNQTNETIKQAFDLVEYRQASSDLLLMAADMRQLQFAIVKFLGKYDPNINNDSIKRLGGGMMIFPHKQDD